MGCEEEPECLLRGGEGRTGAECEVRWFEALLPDLVEGLVGFICCLGEEDSLGGLGLVVGLDFALEFEILE